LRQEATCRKQILRRRSQKSDRNGYIRTIYGTHTPMTTTTSLIFYSIDKGERFGNKDPSTETKCREWAMELKTFIVKIEGEQQIFSHG
jgi:hypothetical protein